jgi:hypothetical protein
MREPRRLMVEYEDGSIKGIEFSQLSPSTCFELSQKGLCPPPAEGTVKFSYCGGKMGGRR